jgi:phosphate-selective porin OprO/OprP
MPRTRSLSFESGLLAPLVVLFMLLLLPLQEALAEKVFFAGYKGGFYIRSEEEGGMELLLGGAFQTDYRYFAEEERADNRFDIRRARLRFKGQLTRYFRFAMEYEFQGNETNNLVDAFGEAVFDPLALRFGQFKEPFSLEWQSVNKAQYFSERSMGYYLGPKRDIGVMLHGALFQEAATVALGLFNGDGDDGSAAGPEKDSPEVAARLTLAPFKEAPWLWCRGLHLGASATYAQIDPINVNLRVKSTGMVGTDLNVYVLSHNTKFGVIQDAGSRYRLGLEAAWTVGPVIFQGEYLSLSYTDLATSGNNPPDADFSSWYASASWWLTGERPVLSKGVVKPIYPDRFFNPQQGTWGAFGLAARYNRFRGDENWINPAAFVSAATADAFSLAVNWVLYPMVRMAIDYTHTSLSDPIRVRVLPDGSADYIDVENVVTCLFSIDF